MHQVEREQVNLPSNLPGQWELHGLKIPLLPALGATSLYLEPIEWKASRIVVRALLLPAIPKSWQPSELGLD